LRAGHRDVELTQSPGAISGLEHRFSKLAAKSPVLWTCLDVDAENLDGLDRDRRRAPCDRRRRHCHGLVVARAEWLVEQLKRIIGRTVRRGGARTAEERLVFERFLCRARGDKLCGLRRFE